MFFCLVFLKKQKSYGIIYYIVITNLYKFLNKCINLCLTEHKERYKNACDQTLLGPL